MHLKKILFFILLYGALNNHRSVAMNLAQGPGRPPRDAFMVRLATYHANTTQRNNGENAFYQSFNEAAIRRHNKALDDIGKLCAKTAAITLLCAIVYVVYDQYILTSKKKSPCHHRQIP